MKYVLYVIGGFFALILLYVLLLVVSAFFVDTTKEYDKNSKFFRFLLNSSTAISFFVGRIKFHVTGMEKLPKGRFLFVCNHRSKFDPLVTWHLLRKYDLAFISKEANFHVPGFGRYIRRCCFMMIDRSSLEQSLHVVNRSIGLIKANEVSVAVYPEGTRTKTGELQPFHNAMFKIAKGAGVPVVVASVMGTEYIRKNYFFRRTDIYFNILDVFDENFVKENNTKTLGDKAFEEINNSLTDNYPERIKNGF